LHPKLLHEKTGIYNGHIIFKCGGYAQNVGRKAILVNYTDIMVINRVIGKEIRKRE
jgi:hypothetical protein